MPQAPMKEYFEHLFEQSGLKTLLLLQRNNLQQIKNVEKLIDVMSQFQSASLDDLLKQVDQLAALSEKEGEAEVELAEGNMVHIMTVHASKGLEFPIVFLPDLAKGPRGDSGNFRFDKGVRLAVQYEKEKAGDPFKTDKKTSPSFGRIKQIAKDQAIEESKRLFYVAVTRARDYLVLSSVDKPSKDSWYSMLLAAMESNLQLQQYIILSEVQEQTEWSGDEEIYQPPTLIDQETAPMVFSVSEVMTFMKDPLEYYYKYVIKVEDEWLGLQENEISNNTDKISGATLGTIVHRACELLDNGYGKDEAIEEAMAIVEEDEHIHRYERSVFELIHQYKQIEKLNLGKTVANEWSFSVQIGDAYIIGEIDKIVEKNNEYHIIDLKTNMSKQYDKLESYYAPQLYLYKMAFEKQYKKEVNQISLFFMRGGLEGFRSVPMNPTFETKIKTAINQMVLLRKNNTSKNEYKNS
ncbi:MAG: PD-(D/E)XK nuclease family protein [Bacillaceae bacterium]|nr:PD-(D/E)XK nuclease family protein [Bacillaceae bacterium]